MSGAGVVAPDGPSKVDTVFCGCGHKAIAHHGSDPAEGCLGIVSHKMPQCPCAYTCTEVRTRFGGAL